KPAPIASASSPSRISIRYSVSQRTGGPELEGDAWIGTQPTLHFISDLAYRAQRFAGAPDRVADNQIVGPGTDGVGRAERVFARLPATAQAHTRADDRKPTATGRSHSGCFVWRSQHAIQRGVGGLFRHLHDTPRGPSAVCSLTLCMIAVQGREHRHRNDLRTAQSLCATDTRDLAAHPVHHFKTAMRVEVEHANPKPRRLDRCLAHGGRGVVKLEVEKDFAAPAAD